MPSAPAVTEKSSSCRTDRSGNAIRPRRARTRAARRAFAFCPRQPDFRCRRPPRGLLKAYPIRTRSGWAVESQDWWSSPWFDSTGARPEPSPAPFSPTTACGRDRGYRRRPDGRPRHPRRRHPGRRQVAAAGDRRGAAGRGRHRRAGLLGGAARQPAPAGRGGLRRPGLARGARPLAVAPGRRQCAGPEPGPGRLHHHLPGHRRRARPASARVPAPSHAAGGRRGPPPAGAGRDRPGRGFPDLRGRRGPGERLVAGHPAAAGMRRGAPAAVRHAGARRRTRHPVAALPQGPEGAHARGRARRAGLGGDRLLAGAGAAGAGRAAGHLRRARWRGHDGAPKKASRSGRTGSPPPIPPRPPARPCSPRCAPASPRRCCGRRSSASATCAPAGDRSAALPRARPPRVWASCWWWRPIRRTRSGISKWSGAGFRATRPGKWRSWRRRTRHAPTRPWPPSGCSRSPRSWSRSRWPMRGWTYPRWPWWRR